MNFETTLRDLEQERHLIDLAITAVKNVFQNRNYKTLRNITGSITGNQTVGSGRRKLTAAAKQKIADAMKKRWAAKKAAAAAGKKLTVVGRKKAA